MKTEEAAETRKEIMNHHEEHSAPPLIGNANGDVDALTSTGSELVTEKGFKKYCNDLLSRVPQNVKSRFREGNFCRWGKEWLPVLELGPFDVEPGPVRDMWLEMFETVSC